MTGGTPSVRRTEPPATCPVEIRMSDPTEELRQKIMLTCRILAMEGMADRITGHVSARIAGTDEMWIRCRSPEEEGVRYTTIDAIRRVNFDGKGRTLGNNTKFRTNCPFTGRSIKVVMRLIVSFTLTLPKRLFAASPNWSFGQSLARLIYRRCRWLEMTFRCFRARTL